MHPVKLQHPKHPVKGQHPKHPVKPQHPKHPVRRTEQPLRKRSRKVNPTDHKSDDPREGETVPRLELSFLAARDTDSGRLASTHLDLLARYRPAPRRRGSSWSSRLRRRHHVTYLLSRAACRGGCAAGGKRHPSRCVRGCVARIGARVAAGTAWASSLATTLGPADRRRIRWRRRTAALSTRDDLCSGRTIPGAPRLDHSPRSTADQRLAR